MKTTVQLETDYLVIGAGAAGMAFVDELIRSTTAITVVVVDSRAAPGGHWIDAYDFVKLHQPANFYGVSSKQLGEGGKDLVSLPQIKAYYQAVMKDLLSSGRVKYFPQCDYRGDGEFKSLMATSMEYKVNVLKKTVDATYMSAQIPSLRNPEFGISAGVNFVPVNGLARNQSPWKKYVIIGGGKTGIDAVLYLLEHSVDPECITWIIPNDYWLFNRNFFFSDNFCNSNIAVMNCILGCEDQDDLFKRWEKCGLLKRIDPKVEPRSCKAGTVNDLELKELRRVKNIVRHGRIDRIEPTRVIFKNAKEIETDEHSLHVDCTANGLPPFIPKKIFEGRKIILQDVSQVQSTYSCAIIAVVESRYPENEEKKNEIIKPIIRPQMPHDYTLGLRDNFFNENSFVNSVGMR